MKVKSFFSNAWDVIKSFLRGAVILTIVPVTVALLDVAGCLSGGLLGPAVLAGVIFVVSFAFITVNLSPKLRKGCYQFIASYGGWLDLVCTILLTYLGFQAGVTMGLAMMMIGLNLSAMFSIVRLSQILSDPVVRADFAKEMGGSTARPKARTKPQPDFAAMPAMS